MPPMRDQIAQQAYELSELRTQRQELRRLNGLLEADCARLTENLSAAKRDMKRQIAASMQEARLAQEDARNAKQQALYAKESAKRARAELEKLKQADPDASANEWKRKYKEVLKLAEQATEAAQNAQAERDEALADLEMAEMEVEDAFSQLNAVQIEASEGWIEVEKLQERSAELEKRVKELEANSTPLHDADLNVSKTSKASTRKTKAAAAVKDERPSLPVPATRSSKRKAATAGENSNASKKAKR